METSRFANIKNLNKFASVSMFPPKWYVGPEIKTLAPPWELINSAHNGMTAEEYKVEFYQMVLNKLDPIEVYKNITNSYTEDVVLLCFEKLEKPGDFCHRRYVAEWFEEALNIKIPEWEPIKTKSSFVF